MTKKRWEEYLKKIPMLKNAVDILKNINSYRFKAYIVGGSVRDVVLGKKPKDIDIATNMPINRISNLYKTYEWILDNGIKDQKEIDKYILDITKE